MHHYHNIWPSRPAWAPPSWIFGPVWTSLYVIIVISYGYVFYAAVEGVLPWIVALPFVLNLILNIACTLFQSFLRNNFLAAIDSLLVLVTLIWLIVAIYPYMPVIAIINIPYLLWVSFSTALQLTVTYFNTNDREEPRRKPVDGPG